MVYSIVVILFLILYMSIRLVSSPANSNCFFYWHKTGKLGNGEGASHYLPFCCLCGDVWGGAKSSKKYRHQLRWRLFIVFNTQLHFSSLYVTTSLFSATDGWTNKSTRKRRLQTRCTKYFCHCPRAVHCVHQCATTAEPKFPFQFQMYWLGM